MDPAAAGRTLLLLCPQRLIWSSIREVLEAMVAVPLRTCEALEDYLQDADAPVPDAVVLAVPARRTNLPAEVTAIQQVYPSAALVLIAEEKELPELGALLDLGVRGCLRCGEFTAASLAADIERLLAGNRVLFSLDLWEPWRRRRAERRSARTERQRQEPLRLRRGSALREREHFVLQALGDGRPQRWIAEELAIGRATVRRVIEGLHQQYGTSTVAELRLHADRGLVEQKAVRQPLRAL
jgi:DNA-binding NarL/FixJ family response regulator